MNIFNRKGEDIEGALPGRKLNLPPVEEQVGDMVRDQFRKRPRSPAVIATELETNATSFEAAVHDAEAAAKAYCATYAELEVEISAKLEAIEAQRKELRKLQASLPRVEKPNEETPSDSDLDSDDNAGTGQDPVQAKPISNIKPLSPRRV
jgi:hypothetical protein